MPPKAAPRRTQTTRRPVDDAAVPVVEIGVDPGSPHANVYANSAATPSVPASAGGSSTSAATLLPSGRHPVQRLQSLKKRGPPAGGSIVPPAGRTHAGAGAASSALGSSATEQAKPTLKYQPKFAARRSKAERDAQEKLEAERTRERLAEAAAIKRGREDGAGGRGRGRGRGSDRGRAGLFAGRGGMMSMAAAAPGSSGWGLRGRGGGRFQTDSREQSFMSGRSSRSILDVGGDSSGTTSRRVSSDESDSGIRVSIDHINLESDDDDDNDDDENDVYNEDYNDNGYNGQAPGKLSVNAKGKLRAKDRAAKSIDRGLRPIRVERHEHEDRVVSVNMESSTNRTTDARKQASAGRDGLQEEGNDDDEDEDEEEEEENEKDDNALFVTETQPRVKTEPRDSDGVAHREESKATDDLLLPAQPVKIRRALNPKKRLKKPKNPRSLLKTKEEIAEFDRHAHDLEVVKELLSVEPADLSAGDAADESGADGRGVSSAATDKLSGQLFLMQFPPLTPKLVLPGQDYGNSSPAEHPLATSADVIEVGATAHLDRGSRPAAVKHEAAAAPAAPAATAANGTSSTTPAGMDSQHQPPPAAAKIVTATDCTLQAGRVGKLNVHASGRVTLNWGGISFELDRATAVDFLQEALIVSPSSADEPQQNTVCAMGQLSGKFTVTPNWEEML